MSSYEFGRGKIREFKPESGENIEDVCKRFVLSKRDQSFLDEFDSAVEAVSDEFYDEAIITEEKLYEFVEQSVEYDQNEFYDAHVEPNGDITYSVLFYNGGQSMSEAIQEAISKISEGINQ